MMKSENLLKIPNLEEKCQYYFRKCYKMLPEGKYPVSTNSFTELRRNIPMERNRREERDLNNTN